MKARVATPAPKVAAGVNVSVEKAAVIAELMAGVGGEYRAFGSNCGAETIGYICGLKGCERSAVQTDTEEELLIFSGLDGRELNSVVVAMRDRGAGIPLKAMLTPHNRDWTVSALAKELAAEHEMMHDRGKRDGDG